MNGVLLKQTVGIDVAQETLDVSLGRIDGRLVPETYTYKTFNNNEEGIMALILWAKKHTVASAPLRFVMEATGVYHERLANLLAAKGHQLSIVLPNKIASFVKTLRIKTVTDKSMSIAIAMFGLEKNLCDWQPPKKVYREMRQLTRERNQLVEDRTVAKNQLHAEEVEAFPNENSVKRLKAKIVFTNAQIRDITDEIAAAVENDEAAAAAVDLLVSLPGVGLLTAATVLAETGGFALIENKRQLASYAGLDVKLKESGTSVRGKPQISKRGNKYLRKAMYMPALAAIRHSEHFKAVYGRITAKTGIKMKGAVAVQRMLLEMMYVIYKSGKLYETDYVEKLAKKREEEAKKAVPEKARAAPKMAALDTLA